jgi:peptide/nickel transport system permease protein
MGSERARAIPSDHAEVNAARESLWIKLRRYPVVPGVVLLLLAVAGIFGPLLAPHDPVRSNILDKHYPPFWVDGGTPSYLLGTDHVGRDILSRILYGARVSLTVVAVSVGSGFVVGTALGLTAGYFGRFVDEAIMRIVDIWSAMPFLMIALVVNIVVGNKIQVVFALLAMLAWAGFVRVVRAQTLSLREMDYVTAARVSGASHLRIMARHLLPGVINTAVVIATLNVGGLILAEAALSFLGAGIQPPTPAWGSMVAEGKDWVVAQKWWQSAFPGIAIFLVVMSFNFMGDWMRDHFDPRLRQI